VVVAGGELPPASRGDRRPWVFAIQPLLEVHLKFRDDSRKLKIM